jgi:methionyl-tRNA formyltransferase
MKIVFMGTPDFAVPSLTILAENHDVVGVITAPDKPAGRGKKLKSSAIKEKAVALGLHILQPTNLKDANFQKALHDLNADLFVVVAFRMLPESVWAMPPKGTINLHASLLPQYRGAAPINRAIMNGETETGMTTFFIEREIDTGKIIARKKVSIGPNETAGELHDRMMVSGADLLLESVNKIESEKVEGLSQSEATEGLELKAAPKIFREDCKIDWSQSVMEIHNHIRGLSPYPAAWTHSEAGGKEIETFKLYETRAEEIKHDKAIGSILVESDTLYIYVPGGRLKVEVIQAPSKKRMKTSDFLRGYSFPDGFKFI